MKRLTALVCVLMMACLLIPACADNYAIYTISASAGEVTVAAGESVTVKFTVMSGTENDFTMNADADDASICITAWGNEEDGVFPLEITGENNGETIVRVCVYENGKPVDGTEMTLDVTVGEKENADVLWLGPDGDFGFVKKEGWEYTQDADVQFDKIAGNICEIKADGVSGFISFCPTEESLKDLNGRDKIITILENFYGPDGALFESDFTVTPMEGGYMISKYSEGQYYTLQYNNAFIFLDKGILSIASNNEDRDKPLEVVNQLLSDLVVK